MKEIKHLKPMFTYPAGPCLCVIDASSGFIATLQRSLNMERHAVREQQGVFLGKDQSTWLKINNRTDVHWRHTSREVPLGLSFILG